MTGRQKRKAVRELRRRSRFFDYDRGRWIYWAGSPLFVSRQLGTYAPLLKAAFLAPEKKV
jgi:hypothetical protein